MQTSRVIERPGKSGCKGKRGHLVVGYQNGFYGKTDERGALQNVFNSKSGEGSLGQRKGMSIVQMLGNMGVF